MRLAGEDAGFLYQELPLQPMGVIAIARLGSPLGPGHRIEPLTLAEVHDLVERRLDELPSLRWKILTVPFGLHHPVVVDDPDFDLASHLHHIQLPPGSGEEDLNRLAAIASQQRLDRRRPLWHLTLVDGLEDGRQAVLVALHHCIADGSAVLTTFSRLFSDPDRPSIPDVVPATAGPPARPGRLLADAARDQARSLPKVPALVKETVRGFRAAGRHRKTADPAAAQPFVDTPVCSLNNARVRERYITRTMFSMADILEVKRVAGVTVNDVVLAVMAGAFRRSLVDAGDLPDRTLLASAPVLLDAPTAPPRQYGNHFSGMTVALGTDIDDPWTRLAHIAESSKAGKLDLDIAGCEVLPKWLDVLPPFVVLPFVRLVHWVRTHFEGRPEMVNVLVSNIRGPEAPWTFGRAQVDELYFAGPPSNGTGAIVVTCSNAGRMSVIVTSFADSLHDPIALQRHLVAALDELVLAAADNAPVELVSSP